MEAPVTHIWYYRGIPSRMGLMLDMSPKTLEKIIYFACYVVLDPGDTPLERSSCSWIESTVRRKWNTDARPCGRDGAGATGPSGRDRCKRALPRIARTATDRPRTKRARIIKRLEVVEAFANPATVRWMVLDAIPVLPPDLRPMVQLTAAARDLGSQRSLSPRD